MALDVSTITSARELEAIARPWLDLLDRADNDLPFLQPEWAACWWDAFQQRSRLIRDSLRVHVVRDEAGAVLGIFPMMLTERLKLGPLRACTLGFLGADLYVTEQRSPIVDPVRQREVARAVATKLARDREWDWLGWEGLDPASEFASELSRVMPLRWGEPEVSNILELPSTWEAFRGGLKRNIKESLRRCTNSLKREGLTAKLVVAETPADVRHALDRFLHLHNLRSQQEDGVQHPDRFAGEIPRRFLRNVCERLAARGVAKVLQLEIQGQVVAARVAFRQPKCLYLYYSGYDPAFSKYSVATTIVAEGIRYAIESGLPRVHLSMGQDVSKSRWGPRNDVRRSAIWVRPRLTSRAAHGLYTWSRDSAWVGRSLGALRRGFD